MPDWSPLVGHGLKAIQDFHAEGKTRFVFRRSVTHTCAHRDEPRVVVDVPDADIREDIFDVVIVGVLAAEVFEATQCSVCKAEGKEG